MPENLDTDLTLPSVVGALPGSCGERELVLTVIFHPLVSRIGEAVVVPRRQMDNPWILGRRSPAFGRPDGAIQQGLEEPHVSRQALALSGNGQTITIRRLPASSRARVGGRELEDSVELDRQQLSAGVPILMAHSVVLLLRLVSRPGAAVVEVPATNMLRGSSVYMQGLKAQIGQAAASDLDVLIRGETGTGKELVAKAIHHASARAQAPLVSVNMAAIVPGLAAATLFGSARGAFTGAAKASQGYFVQAEGGSLFLDEIGDTPAQVQPQLLRALQQREIQVVGGPVRAVDVRVISATDAALEGQDCDFKSALRHRLGACEIVLLPLREHPEDIGELTVHALQSAAAEIGRDELLPTSDTGAAELAAWAELYHSFLCYHWPGNVRELVNFTRQLALASGERLTLPDSVSAALRAKAVVSEAADPDAQRPLRRKIRDIDETEFDSTLQRNGFEVATTARQLQVSRQAVYRRMQDSPRYRLAGQVPQAELERVLAGYRGDAAAAAAQLRVSLSGLRVRLRGSGLAWF